MHVRVPVGAAIVSTSSSSLGEAGGRRLGAYVHTAGYNNNGVGGSISNNNMGYHSQHIHFEHDHVVYGLSQPPSAGIPHVVIQNIRTSNNNNNNNISNGNNMSASASERRHGATPEAMSTLCASADGRYLFGGCSSSGHVYIWLSISGQLLTCFTAHPGGHAITALCVCGSEQDILLTCGADASVRLFRLVDIFSSNKTNQVHKVVKPFRHLVGHTLPVRTALGDPRAGDVVVTAGADRTVRVWHVGTGLCLHTAIAHCVPRCMALTLTVASGAGGREEVASVLVGMTDGSVLKVALFGNGRRRTRTLAKKKQRQNNNINDSNGNDDDEDEYDNEYVFIKPPRAVHALPSYDNDLNKTKNNNNESNVIPMKESKWKKKPKSIENLSADQPLTIGVSSLALSPRHDELVVGYDDGVIRIYDLLCRRRTKQSTAAACVQVHTYAKHTVGRTTASNNTNSNSAGLHNNERGVPLSGGAGVGNAVTFVATVPAPPTFATAGVVAGMYKSSSANTTATAAAGTGALNTQSILMEQRHAMQELAVMSKQQRRLPPPLARTVTSSGSGDHGDESSEAAAWMLPIECSGGGGPWAMLTKMNKRYGDDDDKYNNGSATAEVVQAVAGRFIWAAMDAAFPRVVDSSSGYSDSGMIRNSISLNNSKSGGGVSAAAATRNNNSKSTVKDVTADDGDDDGDDDDDGDGDGDEIEVSGAKMVTRAAAVQNGSAKDNNKKGKNSRTNRGRNKGKKRGREAPGGGGGNDKDKNKRRRGTVSDESDEVVTLQKRVQYLEKYTADLQEASKLLMQAHNMAD